jgi:arylsulfatase A-like enzyme
VPAGLRVAAPVSLTDLQPTLCAWLAADCGDAQGTSFAELLAGEAGASAEREVYAGAPNDPGRGLDALIVGSWKLLAKADGSAALFDLAADPGEERDLAAAQPERAARLAARLAEIRAENEARRERRLAGRAPGQLEAVREETRRGLEALGYVE